MRIVIVGAGLAGLTAARRLVSDGHQVTLLDKGRTPGGRLATRRLGDATFDHGAQFFTVRSPEFDHAVRDLVAAGVVQEWCKGFDVHDGHPRYVAARGMNSLAKHLAVGLDVRCGQLAFAVRRSIGGSAWRVVTDDGAELAADALVLTCPVPQSLALLVTAEVELPARLAGIDYDRTLALLAALDADPAVPAPGGIQSPGGIWSFVGDNRAKGVSARPTVTFHATAPWSAAHWDDAPERVADLLADAATPWLGDAHIVAADVKRWRFATPRTPWPEPCWRSPDAPPLVLAGDAFGPARIEGAFLSGSAAAAALTA